MIKVANNLQRMLTKQAAANSQMRYSPLQRMLAQQTPGNPQIMHSPELGGFHTPGTYPQSMSPERYQQIQALNYINPGVFSQPSSFNSPEDFAMALNTSGVGNYMNPKQIQTQLASASRNVIPFGQMTPEERYSAIDSWRRLSPFPIGSASGPKAQPAIQPRGILDQIKANPQSYPPRWQNNDHRPSNLYEAPFYGFYHDQRYNDYLKAQNAMLAERSGNDWRDIKDWQEAERQGAWEVMPGGLTNPFLHAAYDVRNNPLGSEEGGQYVEGYNPLGITARNPTSDAQVANLASQELESAYKIYMDRLREQQRQESEDARSKERAQAAGNISLMGGQKP